MVAKINGHEFDCRELWYPGNNDFAGVSLPIQRVRMLHQEDKRGAQSCGSTLTAVKPLEYQVEYRALEQSLNITM